MANPTHDPLDAEQAAWHRALYGLAHSDIRWSKEQGWRVVNWALLLYAAVVAFFRYWPSHIAVWSYFLAPLVALVAIAFEWHLHSFAKEARGTIRNIRPKIPHGSDVLGTCVEDSDHPLYLAVQVLLILAGLALTLLALTWLATPGRVAA